jgi:hypothetical protein
MISDEKIEMLQNMFNQLTNLKIKLGRENKYSSDVDSMIDICETADWRDDDVLADKMIRVMTNLSVQGVTGKLNLLPFDTSITRIRKKSISSKPKRCDCSKKRK